MESLLLDSDGDLVMKNGELQFVDGDDELIQTFGTLLQTNKNEWFLDPNEGFDYSVVFKKNYSEDEIVGALNDVAEQMDGISHIVDIEFNFDNRKRKLDVSFKAVKTNGDELEIREIWEVL